MLNLRWKLKMKVKVEYLIELKDNQVQIHIYQSVTIIIENRKIDAVSFQPMTVDMILYKINNLKLSKITSKMHSQA